MRKAYSAPCKFHADEVAGNRINWYRVPPDRQVYEGLHVFHPRVDVDSKSITGLFEKEGPGRFVRQFEPGFDVYGFPGTHVDGDAQDFLGKSPVAKHFLDGELIAPLACVGRECLRAGLALGAHILDRPFVVSLALGANEYWAPFSRFTCGEAGRMFAGKLVTKTPTDFASHTAYFVIEPGKKYRVDLEFDMSANWSWAFSWGGGCTGLADGPFENPATTKRVYYEFESDIDGIFLIQIAQLVSTFGEFKAVYWEEPFPPETYDAGLALGASVADPPPPFGTVAAGLALGAVEASAESDYTLAAGLALGAVEADVGGGSEPGTDCASALLLEADTPLTFDIGAGEVHWFKCGLLLAGGNHVSFQVNSGTVNEFRFYEGDDCPPAVDQGPYPFFPFCTNLGASSYIWLFMKITASGFSGGNYTIEFGLGDCP